MKASVNAVFLSFVILTAVITLSGMIKPHGADDQKEQTVDDEPAVWGPEIDGSRFAISTPRESYRVDQSIPLRLTVENMRDTPVHLIGGPSQFMFRKGYQFDLRLAQGGSAPLTLEGQRQMRIPHSVPLPVVEPGRSVATTMAMLNRFYDMTLAGEYRVTVSRYLAPEQSGETAVELPSNTLRVVVRDTEDVHFPAEPVEWGRETEGCRLSLVSDRESYRFDQPMRFRMILENVGEKPVHIRQADALIVYRFVVTSVGPRTLPDAKPSPLTLEGKRQARLEPREDKRVRLDPGKTDATTLAMFNRLYDMSLLKQYTVTAHRQVWPQGPDAKPVDVPSNTLEISVHERETQEATPR